MSQRASRNRPRHRGDSSPSRNTSSRVSSSSSSESDDGLPMPHINRRVATPPPPDTSEPKFRFYDRSLIPNGGQHACPFAAPDRNNPCSHTPGPRRDRIRHHLHDIRTDGGNATHPIDDPLWEDPIVKGYYMIKRPKKFEPEISKVRVSAAGKRSYVKKVKVMDEKGDEMKFKFESGDIDMEEYSKFLVGAPREHFKRKMEVRDRVNEKLEELRGAPMTKLNMENIGDLETVLAQLNQANTRTMSVRKTLVTCVVGMVGLWENTDGEILTPDCQYQSLEEVRGWDVTRWPRTPSIESYYAVAAILLPLREDEPWDPPSRRNAKYNLERYAKREQGRVEDQINEAIAEGMGDAEVEQWRERKDMWDEVVKVFNASCDLLKVDEEEATFYDEAVARNWRESQRKLWESAKANTRDVFEASYGQKSAVEVIDMVNALSNCWCAHQTALNDEAAAEVRANRLLQ